MIFSREKFNDPSDFLKTNVFCFTEGTRLCCRLYWGDEHERRILSVQIGRLIQQKYDVDVLVKLKVKYVDNGDKNEC